MGRRNMRGMMPRQGAVNQPTAIKAYTDFEGKEIVQLIIELVDDQGNRAERARNNVTVEVKEGGTLLGLETGSNNDMSRPQANSRNANQGKLLAYVKRSKVGTPVTIVIHAEGLSDFVITK